jgi:cell wall-associated NlpC family hydrolase
MTRNHLQNRFLPRRAKRLTAVVLASAASFAGLTMVGGGVDAAPRTKSAIIAEAAGQAVEALARWDRTSHPIDYVRFVQHRDHAATLTERDVELDDGALRDAWAGVSVAKQHAVLSAVSQLGVPYRYLASEPGVGFDCSGLTLWAFATAEVEIPRVSRDQINDATATERDDAEAGDLVYYPGHISIYLGAATMIHSPNSGSHVEITWLPDKSLRFGDAEAAQIGAAGDPVSLVDRTVAVTE